MPKLPGDEPAVAGIVEEISVRGYLQCRLASHVSALWAQLIAGVVFVAMHGSQLLEVKRLLPGSRMNAL